MNHEEEDDEREEGEEGNGSDGDDVVKDEEDCANTPRKEAFDMDALHSELLRLKYPQPHYLQPQQENAASERLDVVIAEGPYLLRHSGIVELSDVKVSFSQLAHQPSLSTRPKAKPKLI